MEKNTGQDCSWFSVVGAQQILSCLPDAVFTTDYQLRITYFNKEAENLIGITQNQALGMYCRDVVKGQLCELGCPIKHILKDKTRFEAETWLKLDHDRIPILLSVSPLQDKSNNVIGFFFVIKDISDFKNMLIEIEQSKRKLTERNKRIVAALKELRRTHRQLLQAQKMESIGVLASGVAHDFNNLLSGILGYTALILRQVPKDSSVYNFAKIIETSALRASDLTKQLLFFGRQGGQLQTIKDINEIVKEVILILDRAMDKGVEIKLDLTEGLPPVRVNASQIEQVLMNLCVNARDAMDGKGVLYISTRLATKKDLKRLPRMKRRRDYICISVKDTGPGIPENIRDKIFDPFFTTKGEGRGTGLGLAIAYGIIKEHRGVIEVISEIGRGTCFNIYLPVAKIKTEKKVEKERKVQVPSKGNEAILLVDDEEIIRTLVKTVLEDNGYKVFTASDGMEALELISQKKAGIDLVLLDYNMPKMSGLEVARYIKDINPNTKIIICSGYHINIKKEKEIVNGILLKPFKIEELLNKVRATLGSTPI